MVELTGFATTEGTKRSALAIAWWAAMGRFLLHGLIVSTWVSRIPSIQSNLGLTNALLGMCLLGTAVGALTAVPLTGWLVTRFGSKAVTTWSTVGFCLALVAPSLAVSAATLFAAMAIYGALAAANDVSINSQAVAVETALGTPAMSRFHAMFSVGGMTGAVLGGFAAAHGIAPRLHFGIAATLCLMISAGTAPLLLDADSRSAKRVKRLSLRRIPMALVTLSAIGFCMFLSEARWPTGPRFI